MNVISRIYRKFTAPKNNWDMKSSDSWWPLMGSIRTYAGNRVTPEQALSYTAVASGIRVISETVASLPCNMMAIVDDRTERKATDHPLYNLLHSAPNPEQDSMTFFDQQSSFLPSYGNCYAEIQRNGWGEISALWPIHPSRIPVGNIRRNPREGESGWEKIYAGQPGELVYWVKNDDGTNTPIATSDMLHVAGPLSANGVTGRSIIQLGANSIGIGMATEEHAGAFFKNGAVANIALTSTKPVGKERAEALRQQWQQTFGGVHNHYKTLLLEDGITPVPFNITPEDSQLVMARQFSVNEVARLLRIPPHMLADLTRSTYSNIEQQSLEFVQYSLIPWLVRWERAMSRQLLTDEERGKYRFKFNVNGLLRGDAAARGTMYDKLFSLGVLSPNDIRGLEDLNPVEGGDQRFIRRDLIPLDKISEYTQSEIDKAAPAIPDTQATNNQDLRRILMSENGSFR